MSDVASIISELDDHGYADTSSTRKVGFINQAIQDICRREAWPFLEKTATLTFDGTNATPLTPPSDLRAVLKLTDISSGVTLTPITLDEAEALYGDALTMVDDPLAYYFVAGTINIFPVPVSTKTLRLRYIKTPATVIATDIESAIAIPPLYHEAIVFRALMRLYALDDDTEMYPIFQGLYESSLAQMRAAMWQRQYDRPDHIQIIDPDDFDYE